MTGTSSGRTEKHRRERERERVLSTCLLSKPHVLEAARVSREVHVGSTTLQMDSGSVILFCLFVCTDTCVAVRLGRCRFHTKQQRAHRDRERQRGTSTIFFLSSFLPFLLSCCLSVCSLSLSLWCVWMSLSISLD